MAIIFHAEYFNYRYCCKISSGEFNVCWLYKQSLLYFNTYLQSRLWEILQVLNPITSGWTWDLGFSRLSLKIEGESRRNIVALSLSYMCYPFMCIISIERGNNGLFITLVPKVLLIYNVFLFVTITNWRTSIYRLLSYPFRSMIIPEYQM